MLSAGVTGPAIPLDFPGAVQTTALGINDAGQIVGSYVGSGAASSPRRAGAEPAQSRRVVRPLPLLWCPPG